MIVRVIKHSGEVDEYPDVYIVQDADDYINLIKKDEVKLLDRKAVDWIEVII